MGFQCPGCNCAHNISIAEGAWVFNGDMDAPTFSPSILVNAGLSNPNTPRCHSFVRGGRIMFLLDCTHDLRGKTVDLPEV